MRPTLAALVLSLLVAAPASGANTVFQSRHLWATVNVCDTEKYPDRIGVRGSMPGSDKAGERMFMRFQVQFRSAADGLWHTIASGADSGFVDVGSARFKARQAGFRFRFVPRADGAKQVLRGVVTFEWRKGDEVVRRARKATEAGHPSVAEADPAGYSRARCELR